MQKIEKKNIQEWNTVIGNAARGTRYRNLYKRLQRLLSTPSRRRGTVSIYRLNAHTKDGDNVIVPKKILFVGKMDHKVNVAVLECSSKAAEELKSSGSRIIDIKEMVNKDRINIIV